MKKLILLSVFIFVALSCSNDDKVSSPLLGKWEITEVRSINYLDTDWSPWSPSSSLGKYIEFVDAVNVKRQYVDNTFINGTYTYDVDSDILIVNFPEADTPVIEYKVLELSTSNMMLERGGAKDISQGKYVKVAQ